MSDNSPQGRRSSVGSVLLKTLIIVVLIAAAAYIWIVIKRPTPPPQAMQALPVATIKPTVGNLDQTITLDSFVNSDSIVTVLPKVSGTLEALDVKVGSLVKQGEVIGKIDPKPYELKLNQAKALYDGATSLYDRQKKLYTTGATSQQNYDQAQANYQNAKSQYELAQLQLGYTSITSPVDGTVVKRHVATGALVSQQRPIVTVTDNKALVIQTPVPESYARLFQLNAHSMEIDASIPAMGGQRYPLKVRNLSPAIDVSSKTFTVECDFTGSTAGLLPGMFTQVTFVLHRRSNVAYLPYSVLVGGNTLWYVDSKGKAQFFTFTPSYHNDSDFEVPEKYRDYQFILAGQHFLSAGSPVKVSNTGQGAQ